MKFKKVHDFEKKNHKLQKKNREFEESLRVWKKVHGFLKNHDFQKSSSILKSCSWKLKTLKFDFLFEIFKKSLRKLYVKF